MAMKKLNIFMGILFVSLLFSCGDKKSTEFPGPKDQITVHARTVYGNVVYPARVEITSEHGGKFFCHGMITRDEKGAYLYTAAHITVPEGTVNVVARTKDGATHTVVGGKFNTARDIAVCDLKPGYHPNMMFDWHWRQQELTLEINKDIFRMNPITIRSVETDKEYTATAIVKNAESYPSGAILIEDLHLTGGQSGHWFYTTKLPDLQEFFVLSRSSPMGTILCPYSITLSEEN
jgi:hypothetical protein